ncbi:MAG: helix-turn-helix domain-containing protein, partial [Chloroflexi bacterium]|nr:helix-turn-helix domain-containing protein [Chloroflexota bacterium]
MARSEYQARVPAVARAVRALEHLAGAQQPLSLSALSRAIEVGPSSLLAILTTLRGAGLVSRSGRDGRYVPGPGLVALGAAAAQRLEPLHTFDLIAAELVDQLGETVLLWVQHGDGLVMAAAREGTQPLRYMPPLGLRLPATGWGADDPTHRNLLEGELEPDVWMVAANVDDGALLGIVGPVNRLQGAAGSEARRALQAAVAGESAWAGAGPIEPGELDAFLSQPLVASLSYLSRDGYPASVPLWYDWDGGAFWLVPSPGAEWAEHVRRNPRVSLAISESLPPLRRVLARGPMQTADDTDGSRWRAVEARLAARYARLDALRLLGAQRDHVGVLLRLEPEQLIAWRGLVRPLGTLASAEPSRTVGGGSVEPAPAATMDASRAAGAAPVSASPAPGAAPVSA